MNYLHQFYLIKAELYKIKGKNRKAEACYEKAILLAQKNKYPQDEALSNELTGKFYLTINKSQIARTYLIEAHYGYSQWEALAKTQQLETQFPHFFIERGQRPLNSKKTQLLMTTTTSSEKSKEIFDLLSILKSTQAISKEIILEELLDHMIQIVMESAGAQKAILLLQKESNWYIEAQSEIDKKTRVLE